MKQLTTASTTSATMSTSTTTNVSGTGTRDIDIQFNKLKNDLQKIPHVDQVVINKVSKTIKVTRTPHNFVTTTENKLKMYSRD